jgi:hypothetical protein
MVAQVGGWRVRGQPGVHTQFKASVGYIVSPSQKANNKTKKGTKWDVPMDM